MQEILQKFYQTKVRHDMKSFYQILDASRSTAISEYVVIFAGGNVDSIVRLHGETIVELFKPIGNDMYKEIEIAFDGREPIDDWIADREAEDGMSLLRVAIEDYATERQNGLRVDVHHRIKYVFKTVSFADIADIIPKLPERDNFGRMYTFDIVDGRTGELLAWKDQTGLWEINL